jgi:hypothetical protein
MEALVHLIDSSGRAVGKANCGINVFDTCAEQKAVHVSTIAKGWRIYRWRVVQLIVLDHERGPVW